MRRFGIVIYSRDGERHVIPVALWSWSRRWVRHLAANLERDLERDLEPGWRAECERVR